MTLKLPLLSLDDLGMTKKHFPPRRRAPLNVYWDNLNQWKHGIYMSFVEPGKEFRVSMNIFQAVVDFWRDVVVPREISITTSNALAQNFIDGVHDNLLHAMRGVVEDMVLYGVGIFDNRRPRVPEALDPRYWFPVTPAYDFADIFATIIALPYSENDMGVPDRLRVTKIVGNLAVARSYRMSGLMLSEPLGEAEELAVPDGVLVPVTLDNSLYGYSQMRDLLPYIRELHRRETAISESMDRVSDPHLALPESSIVRDDNDIPMVDLRGMVIPLREEEPEPGYVSYDANYESQEEAVRRVVARIWWLAGISPSLLEGEGQLSSSIPMSGAALRRLALVTTMKTAAFWEALDPAVKETLRAQMQMENIAPPEPDAIKINWGEPLLVGEDEESQNEQEPTREERVPSDPGQRRPGP